MPKQFEQRLKAGRELRDRLKVEGKHFDAQIVQNLCQSLTNSNVMLGQLHADNMELRRQRTVELEITGDIS